jgi:hypothetical protein
VRDGVGRVRVGEAPMWPGPGWRFAREVDYCSRSEKSEKSEKEESEKSEEYEEWAEGEEDDEDDEDMRMVGVEEWLGTI